MINISKISVFISGKDLFKDVSFTIRPKDRIGLTGKNGAGKSTILKIISGEREPTSGSIDISSGKTIGYLPQEMNFSYKQTVFGETMSVFKQVLDLESELQNITHQLETRTDYESEDYSKLIERLNEIHVILGTLDAEKIESKVEKILKGLGFKREEFERPLSEFSGGWQMRVELAKILLTEPSLILLDEPTNHLDIDSILWLEQYFINYPGAILLISHDRRFLDNVTNRTIEIVFGKIYDYSVPYSKYLIERQERYETQIATFKNQQKFIETQERFIERFKAKASKAKAAQSKAKQLDKLDRIELDDFDTQTIKFTFPPAPRSGHLVVNVEGMSKSYGPKSVLEDVNIKVLRGDRIAFVGKNGMGKSTLVKIINKETDCKGVLELGHNVKLGYYAQIQEKTLDPNATILSTLEDEATGDWTKGHKLRGLLGAFLFSESDVDKKVKVLSGGEKSRLALARLLLNEVNLLILDEPTNHLDMSAKEVLKEALMAYNGTLIVVSHDRDFLDGLTSVTYEFKNRGIKEHLGEIGEFLNKYKHDHFRDFEADKGEKELIKKSAKTEAKPKSAGKEEYSSKKEKEANVRKLNKLILRSERRISQLEGELEELEKLMSDPDFYQNDAESKEVFFKHSETKKKLDQKMLEWENQCEELDALT
ncbi:MAG: glycosyl transferase family 2 [Crocinitomicaceae bacterium]|nr:glycosyl transferase family 2 [Crocinitomicaceae bacterium]|tara:strand:+ start:672 stop:2633 length:1962 start_codon:yes stop_codon:yes gene_type:complete